MGFTDNYKKQVKFFTNTPMTLQSKNMFLVQCIQYIRQNVQLGTKLRPHVRSGSYTLCPFGTLLFSVLPMMIWQKKSHYHWQFFTTIRQQIWQIFDPSPPKQCQRLKWMVPKFGSQLDILPNILDILYQKHIFAL